MDRGTPALSKHDRAHRRLSPAGELTPLMRKAAASWGTPTAFAPRILPMTNITNADVGRDMWFDARRQPPRTLRELLENPLLLQPPPALLQGIAYEGRVTLLSAREKSGKSTLLTQAVAALSAGSNFLGADLQPARSLIYSIDEAVSDTVQRLHAYNADPDEVGLQTDRPSAAEMRDEIEGTGAKLVVVDTLAELWNGLIDSDRDAGHVGRFLRPYIEVARETRAALVLLHHTTKLGEEYRGSVQLGASVDLVLTLGRPRVRTTSSSTADWNDDDADDGRRVLRGIGRGGVKVDLRLAFDGERYRIGDAPMPLRSRVLALLAGGPASGNSLEERLGGRRETVLATLRELHETGLLEPQGDGPRRVWRLAPRSDDAVPGGISAGTSREAATGAERESGTLRGRNGIDTEPADWGSVPAEQPTTL